VGGLGGRDAPVSPVVDSVVPAGVATAQPETPTEIPEAFDKLHGSPPTRWTRRMWSPSLVVHPDESWMTEPFTPKARANRTMRAGVAEADSWYPRA
jgi:hypothetical protein